MSSIINEQNTLDNTNPIVDDSKGVNIVDSTPGEIVAPVDGAHVPVSFRKEKTVPDKPWTQQDRVERKIKLPDTEWTLTDPQGTVLATYDVPRDLLQNEISSEPFDRFLFSHFDYVDIHINVVGNRLVQGLVGVYYIRSQIPDFRPFGNLASITTLDHVHLQANEDTSAVLRIPFTYFKDWINLRTSDTLGQLFVVVFNPVMATAASPITSLLVKSWASFINTQFRVPRTQAAPLIRTPANIIKVARYEKVLRRVLEKEYEEKYNKTESNKKSQPPLVTPNAGILASLAAPFLSQLASTVVPKIVSKVGDSLDKPQIGATIDAVTRYEQNFLNQSEGPEQLSYCGFKPSTVQLTDADHFNTDINEMSLDYLLQEKPSYVATIPVSSTDNISKLLFRYRVGPNAVSPFNSTATQNVTMIDFFSRFYTLWRGPIKFIIEGVMSSFHELRIDLVYEVDVDNIIPWDDAITQYYHTIVLRAESNTYSVMAPFFSSTPFKRIYTGQTELSSDPEPGKQPFEEYFTGNFSMYLSNFLIAPEAVAPRIEINIYQLAGPGFEFAAPTYYGNIMEGVEPGIPGIVAPFSPPKVQPNMGPEMSQNETDQKQNSDSAIQPARCYNWNMPHSTQPSLVFGNDTQDQNYDSEHIGERNMDLREMLKRYIPLDRHNFQLPTDPTIISEIEKGLRPLINVVTIDAYNNQGAEAFISSCFRNFRGPQCFKIRCHLRQDGTQVENNNIHHGWVSFMPYSDTTPASVDDVQRLAFQFPEAVAAKALNQLAPRVYFNERTTAEFKVPYYQHTKSALIKKGYDVNNPNASYFQDHNHTTRLVIAIYVKDVVLAKNTIFADIDRSFADETQLGVWVGLPRVSYIKGLYPSGPVV